jgi:hypothetical protein
MQFQVRQETSRRSTKLLAADSGVGVDRALPESVVHTDAGAVLAFNLKAFKRGEPKTVFRPSAEYGWQWRSGMPQ